MSSPNKPITQASPNQVPSNHSAIQPKPHPKAPIDASHLYKSKYTTSTTQQQTTNNKAKTISE